MKHCLIKRVVFSKQQTIDSLLDIYIEILNRCPTLRTVCMKVVTILSRYWPTKLTSVETDELLQNCHRTIQQLMTEEELENAKY